MVDGWTGRWEPEKDYSNYPEEKLCDMDLLYIELKKLYPDYKPETSWESILYMIFGICSEDEIDSYDTIEDYVEYVQGSGGLQEFDFED